MDAAIDYPASLSALSAQGEKTMKQKTISKLLRAILIAAVLLIALVTGGTLNKSGCVEARTCDEAMNDYFNADSTYHIARLSYFYGEPTTCQQDCQGSGNQTQCLNDCQINRRTTLSNAEIGLFSASGATCTPITIDECAQARAMADDCRAQYNFNDYSDPEERDAVYSQYMACREASKIDRCQ